MTANTICFDTCAILCPTSPVSCGDTCVSCAGETCDGGATCATCNQATCFETGCAGYTCVVTCNFPCY